MSNGLKFPRETTRSSLSTFHIVKPINRVLVKVKMMLSIEIQRFILYRNERNPEICPVRAFNRWMAVLAVRQGACFPFVDDDDVIQHHTRISNSQFTDRFRSQLEQVNVQSVKLFGAHSFRRGGCQFLATELNMSISAICGWAGWSNKMNFDVIKRYLHRDNDDDLHITQATLHPNNFPRID